MLHYLSPIQYESLSLIEFLTSWRLAKPFTLPSLSFSLHLQWFFSPSSFPLHRLELGRYVRVEHWQRSNRKLNIKYCSLLCYPTYKSFNYLLTVNRPVYNEALKFVATRIMVEKFPTLTWVSVIKNTSKSFMEQNGKQYTF